MVSSCSSPKNWLYLQDMVPGEEYPVDIKYEATIMRDDRLKITVSGKNPELAIPFNIHGGSFRVGADGDISSYQGPASAQDEGYRVDVDGYIDFPILGKLRVEGLTVTQAIDLIKTRIEEGNYMKDPLVTIEFLNFKYTVLGAIASTGTYSADGDKVTLFEAIARAGGLTQRAKVDKIAVIREVQEAAHQAILVYAIGHYGRCRAKKGVSDQVLLKRYRLALPARRELQAIPRLYHGDAVALKRPEHIIGTPEEMKPVLSGPGTAGTGK